MNAGNGYAIGTTYASGSGARIKSIGIGSASVSNPVWASSDARYIGQDLWGFRWLGSGWRDCDSTGYADLGQQNDTWTSSYNNSGGSKQASNWITRSSTGQVIRHGAESTGYGHPVRCARVQ